MSEAKRYVHKPEKMQKVSRFYGPNSERQYTLAKDFDRVTAERDAALADLSKQDRVLRSSVPEEHKGCTSPVGAVQNYIGELEQRLTAADERNDHGERVLEIAVEDVLLLQKRVAVLEGLLNLAQGHIGDASLSRDIDAALKLEEGGGDAVGRASLSERAMRLIDEEIREKGMPI